MNNVFVAVHALISEGNNILLLKRSKDDDYQPGLWDIPGGTVEFGETIECALQREIMEEVGLQVEHISPLYIYTNNSELPQRQTFQIVMKRNLINDKNILSVLTGSKQSHNYMVQTVRLENQTCTRISVKLQGGIFQANF